MRDAPPGSAPQLPEATDAQRVGRRPDVACQGREALPRAGEAGAAQARQGLERQALERGVVGLRQVVGQGREKGHLREPGVFPSQCHKAVSMRGSRAGRTDCTRVREREEPPLALSTT